MMQKKEKTLTFLINNEGSLIFPEVDEEFVDVMESLSPDNAEIKLFKDILQRHHFGPHVLCG